LPVDNRTDEDIEVVEDEKRLHIFVRQCRLRKPIRPFAKAVSKQRTVSQLFDTRDGEMRLKFRVQTGVKDKPIKRSAESKPIKRSAESSG
jgi:hypothetical protein